MSRLRVSKSIRIVIVVLPSELHNAGNPRVEGTCFRAFRQAERPNGKPPLRGGCSLLGLLVRRVLLAPFAVLGELEAGLELLLVLGRVVVGALALRALELDEVVLGHKG